MSLYIAAQELCQDQPTALNQRGESSSVCFWHMKQMLSHCHTEDTKNEGGRYYHTWNSYVRSCTCTTTEYGHLLYTPIHAFQNQSHSHTHTLQAFLLCPSQQRWLALRFLFLVRRGGGKKHVCRHCTFSLHQILLGTGGVEKKWRVCVYLRSMHMHMNACLYVGPLLSCF